MYAIPNKYSSTPIVSFYSNNYYYLSKLPFILLLSNFKPLNEIKLVPHPTCYPAWYCVAWMFYQALDNNFFFIFKNCKLAKDKDLLFWVLQILKSLNSSKIFWLPTVSLEVNQDDEITYFLWASLPIKHQKMHVPMGKFSLKTNWKKASCTTKAVKNIQLWQGKKRR